MISLLASNVFQVKAEVSRTQAMCLFCIGNLSEGVFIGRAEKIDGQKKKNTYCILTNFYSIVKCEHAIWEILFQSVIWLYPQLSEKEPLRRGSENDQFSCTGGHIVGSTLIWGHWVLLSCVRKRDLWSTSEFKRPGKTYKCCLDTGRFSQKKYFYSKIGALGVTRPKLWSVFSRPENFITEWICGW